MGMPEHQACLLLGSNIDPEQNLPRAIELLREKVTVIRSSSVWQSPPIGAAGPDFLNLALLISTPMQAGQLKERVLRPLEARLGRVRTADKFAPRTIDLDIILFDETVLDPDLFRYAHRAVPVGEILPELLSERGEHIGIVASELLKSTPMRLKTDVFN
jgi:2-amino-4-hydroxy-6-hydroxymethyldihydropteridine diphosphokinase